MDKDRVIIMGAAGRDFHNFNTHFKDNPNYEVVAFTATQIPDIQGRQYPPELAGDLYPDGIPIIYEGELPNLIREKNIDTAVLSYSDLSFQYVMERASLVNATGANLMLLGTDKTMYESSKPVISICAVRTGAGKSQTARRTIDILHEMDKTCAVIRHPMPYGNLVKQRVQKFEDFDDLDKHDCTVEEREEYEPHLERGTTVFAGVDYESILREAEKEDVDFILWEGGNNDTPFFEPDLHIVVADPHRPGHETKYYPGRTNALMADVLVINKIDSAEPNCIQEVRNNLKALNSSATMVEAASPLSVENPSIIEGKNVLVIEDGPTLTHGNMEYGAGVVAAQKFGAKSLVNPRPAAVGSIKDTYQQYSHMDKILPAMGYDEKQLTDLEETIAGSDPESIVIATPINLEKLIDVDVPTTRVKYELQEIGSPNLTEILENFAQDCQ